MLAVNYSQFREHMKKHLDTVTDSFEPLTVTRKAEGGNVVVLSERMYNNLLENLYLRQDKANYDWLMKSKAELAAGKVTAHELTEEPDE